MVSDRDLPDQSGQMFERIPLAIPLPVKPMPGHVPPYAVINAGRHHPGIHPPRAAA